MLKKRFVGMLAFVFAISLYALSAIGVSAAVPSATSTLDTIMGSIIETTVDLATTIFTTYWPYLLVFGVIAALVGAFARFVKLGGRK